MLQQRWALHLLHLRHLLLQLLHPGQEVPHAACQLTVSSVALCRRMLCLKIYTCSSAPSGARSEVPSPLRLGLPSTWTTADLGHADLGRGVADGNLLFLSAAIQKTQEGWGQAKSTEPSRSTRGEAELSLETHPWGDGEPMLLEALHPEE